MIRWNKPLAALALAAFALAGCSDGQEVPTAPQSTPLFSGVFEIFQITQFINFEATGLSAEDKASVEGLGTVNPWLDIQSTATGGGDGFAQLVRNGASGEEYRAYSAAQGPNSCLPSGEYGFSDVVSTILSPRVAHSYDFTFGPEITVSSFSISMADHGDFRQSGGTGDLAVTLTAYDAQGAVLGSDAHVVPSVAGAYDACDSDGKVTLAVQASGIAKLSISQTGFDAGVAFDDIAFQLESGVPIDIKPGSDPNCFNNDGHGVIPIAILSTPDFDATQVDPSTVTLDGLGVAVRGKGDKLLASIEDVSGDGLPDLVVKIEDFDDVWESGTTLAYVTGQLFDGTWIFGSDYVCITQ